MCQTTNRLNVVTFGDDLYFFDKHYVGYKR